MEVLSVVALVVAATLLLVLLMDRFAAKTHYTYQHKKGEPPRRGQKPASVSPGTAARGSLRQTSHGRASEAKLSDVIIEQT